MKGSDRGPPHLADIDHQAVTDEKWRADGSEKVLGNLEFSREASLPDLSPRRQFQADQEPLGRIDVNPVALDDRSRSRPAAVAQPIPVCGGELVLPELLACLGVQALDHDVVLDTVRIDQVRMPDGR